MQRPSLTAFSFVAGGLVSILLLLHAPDCIASALPRGDDILKNLASEHPRLFLLKEDLPRIRTAVDKDPVVRHWYELLEADAEKIFAEPPVERILLGSTTPQMLRQSRLALHRISTLALLYHLDGDARKLARARKEMLAAAALEDWHPPHFLDVAELTNAMAIGYDWLFDSLSPEDRATIRSAIVEKGLKAGRQAFLEHAWWTDTENNWTIVCNGSMTIGALAVADEEPDLAREMIDQARQAVMKGWEQFEPNGAGQEGPGYWVYATKYATLYLAALESALGTDFGFVQATPGFTESGLYRIYSIGPFGWTFNYADNPTKVEGAPQMLWFGRAFSRPEYAGHEREMVGDHPDIFHLLWARDDTHRNWSQYLPLDRAFYGYGLAFLRSAWGDPRATYVGFKGGIPKKDHNHLDLGSFVLDALGQRWAVDLAGDDYQLPDYWGELRWTYYRLRNEGHNTLTLDDDIQNPSAAAPVISFLSTPTRAFAVVDLATAYTPKATRALRGMALLDRKQVLVEDEVELNRPVNVIWNFHTRAQIHLEEQSALLSQGGENLEARIMEPRSAHFEVISGNPPPPQAQQSDVHNLFIRLPLQQGKVRIVVLFSPGAHGPVPAIEPLENWIALATSGRLEH